MKILYTICLMLFAAIVMGQEMPMRHSTLGSEAWVSCTTSANPNPARAGNSHWVRFNLGNIYALRKVTLWNFNQPDSLNMGFQSFYIDYKNENDQWLNLGTFNMNMAPGSSFYEGQEVADFMNKSVKEIVITGISNFGGSCYGLSEVRFDINNSALAVTIIDPRLDCRSSAFKWEAKSEENIDKYILQGSDDLSVWAEVDQIKGSKSKNYQLKASKKFTYYRLKILENDGIENFSKVLFNQCNFTSEDIIAMPNPATEGTSLRISDLSNLTGNVSVFNEVGAIVKSFPRLSLSKEINLNISELPSGQYYIVLEHSEKNKVVPITKL